MYFDTDVLIGLDSNKKEYEFNYIVRSTDPQELKFIEKELQEPDQYPELTVKENFRNNQLELIITEKTIFTNPIYHSEIEKGIQCFKSNIRTISRVYEKHMLSDLFLTKCNFNRQQETSNITENKQWMNIEKA